MQYQDIKQKLFKNIKYNFIFKFFALISSFFIYPILINHMTIEEFGIYVTLMSFTSFLIFFDLGLGKSLRNKMLLLYAEFKSLEAKQYFYSTTFFVFLSLVFLSLIYILSTYFINYTYLLNIKIEPFYFHIFILFLMFMFLINLGNDLYYAYHKSSRIIIHESIHKLLFLIFIIIITYYFQKELLNKIILTYIISFIFIYFGGLLYFISTHKTLILKRKYYRVKYLIQIDKIKELYKKGFHLFLISLSTFLLIGLDKLYILNFSSAENVVIHEVIYKFFSLFFIFSTLILSPFWSTFTTLHTQNQLKKLKKIIYKKNIYLISLSLIMILFIFITQDIIKIWLNKDLNIQMELIILICFNMLFLIISGFYTQFLMSINQVKFLTKVNLIMVVLKLTVLNFYTYFFNHINFLYYIVTINIIIYMILSIVTIYITYKKLKINHI